MSSQPVPIPDDSPMSYDLGELGILNNLPAYNVYAGVDRQLDLLRQVYSSEEYYPLIVPFPQSQNISINALQQLSGNLSVPPGSILTQITGWSSQGIFKLRVFDSSTALDLFYGMWGYANNDAPALVSGSSVASDTPDVQGSFMLNDPYMVIVQNALQVTVMNMASATANVQVAFHFACPIRGIRLTTNAIIEGVD